MMVTWMGKEIKKREKKSKKTIGDNCVAPMYNKLRDNALRYHEIYTKFYS